MLTLLLAVISHLLRLARHLWRKRSFRPYRQASLACGAARHWRRKPEWARQDVIRLKALMRKGGTCRSIAAAFNRRFALTREMTVGRTWVSEVIRNHRYEIDIARREIKNAKPRPMPKQLVWGIDLTGKTDARGELHPVLGIIDHGTRGNLDLTALACKSSFTLLGHLFLAIGRFGKPATLRTDNEPVFTSGLFRLALFLLGMRHQRIDPHCPWQNGRIERFFGTLKEKLDRLAVDSLPGLNRALAEFRFFYNHVRRHQNLGGATPAEAWAGVDPYASKVNNEYWFEAWDGLLRGYYLRR